MRAFSWLFIPGAIVLLLLILAIAVGSTWLNNYIHSPAFRHEIELRASDTLGGPVQIQHIDLGLFTGIKLQGLATQVDSSRLSGQGTLVAKVEHVNCTYSLLDLLRRRLTLTGVTLVKPDIVLTRQPPTTVAPPTTSSAPVTNPGSEDTNAAPFQFVLDGAKIKEGSISIKNEAGTVISNLTGIDADANTSAYYEGKEITGHLKIADLVFAPNLHVTEISTPWTFDAHGNFITAKNFEASAFGGRLAGDYVLDASGPSVLDVNAKGLQVEQVGVATHVSSARLSGSLDLQSKWRGIETGQLNGEGDAQLTNGKLQGVRLLQDLGSILRIRELTNPVIKMQTHFLVANGQTRFVGLRIDSDVFSMTGDGVIGANGELNADMVLILSTDAMGRIPRYATSFFIQQQQGSGSIAFHLGGTVNEPRTDLAARILMQGGAVQNVISGALDRLFHKHH